MNNVESFASGGAAPSMLDAALRYARAGIPVFPVWGVRDGHCACPKGGCSSAGKHPVASLVPQGLHDATCDEAVIRQWWTDAPDANIAVPTGARSGWWALDVDGELGRESVAMLGTLALEIATAPTQRTGNGHHYLFRFESGVRCRAAVRPGIDVRGEGGYIVVSPSVHRSGRRYEWANGAEPGPAGLVEAPRWLVEIVTARAAVCPAPTDAGAPIEDGSRNDTLFREACAMRARGGTDADVASLLADVNSRRCKPPLDATEVEAITESSKRYEEAVPPPEPTPAAASEDNSSTSAQLVEIARQRCTFFRTPDDQAYATIGFETHTEVPGRFAVDSALDILEGVSHFEGEERRLHVRVARRSDRIYIDLCDERWRVVEVTKEGWSVPSASPVVFRREKGMAALPVPERGGSIADLRPFLGGGDDAFILVVGWVLGALGGASPYPILNIQGEQGSGKSMCCRIIRALTDPAQVALRAPPTAERDLVVAAHNCHVVAYDNISSIPNWLADGLCRVSTGGGFGTRELYSDASEVVFDVTRPVIVNGIPDLLSRPDLADRAIVIRLPVMEDRSRRSEAEIWAAFQAVQPRVFGVLLDAMSCALRRRPSVVLDETPRMADFAAWVVAASPALGWGEEDFLAAYARNQAESVEAALETDPVANAIATLLVGRDIWTGTPTELLNELTFCAPEVIQHGQDWPRTPKGLATHLKRVAPALRRVGIHVSRGRSAEQRLISLQAVRSSNEDAQQRPKSLLVPAAADAVGSSLDESLPSMEDLLATGAGSDLGDPMLALPPFGGDESDGSDGSSA